MYVGIEPSYVTLIFMTFTVIECVFAVVGHVILKIIAKIKHFTTFMLRILSTANMESGDTISDNSLIYQKVLHRMWCF